MTERPSGEERVVLVHINFPAGKIKEDLEEFKELALSAGAAIMTVVSGTRSVPDSKYFVGSGKAEEIRDTVLSYQADIVLFNHVLSPAQERNLERLIACRVLDRTGLILDIFAQRARSFEGKLQVELAQLKHLSTRLVKGWTHLERQRGGIGLRGPGETQLETDRRLIRNRIKFILARLSKLRKQREMGRRSRRKAIVPTIALVGYTNAGKSTLFNKLTGASAYVANQLFATLDPTLRRINYKETGPVIVADTVGFIRHLPPYLIEAFHATLEEVSEASLLLHVVDVSDDERDAHMDEVNHVLEVIGATNVPCLFVYNKIDLLSNGTVPRIDRNESGLIKRVYVSAHTGLGLSELIAAIGELLGKEMVQKELFLTPKRAKLRANLYERGLVLSEDIDEMGNFHLLVRMPRSDFEKLFHSR